MQLTPDFDLVIVPTGDQEGSAGMDGDASDGALRGTSTRAVTWSKKSTFVLLESVYQDAHAVVP